jgi:ATP-dependent DNA helicase RecG
LYPDLARRLPRKPLKWRVFREKEKRKKKKKTVRPRHISQTFFKKEKQEKKGKSCNAAGVEIKYENADTDFKIEFSRIDRNKSPLSGQKNDRINDHISDLEQAVLSCLREEPGMTNAELIVKTGKSQRTITRVLAALKGKGLITRIGSNKTGYWQVK